MAYLECAKGGGPGGLGEKPALFVTECLNFDVLEEKISKTAKNTIIKNYGRLKGGQAQGPPKYATGLNYNFLQLGRRSGGRPQRTVYPRWLPVNTTLVGLEPTTFRLLVRRATSSATDSSVIILRRSHRPT